MRHPETKDSVKTSKIIEVTNVDIVVVSVVVTLHVMEYYFYTI